MTHNLIEYDGKVLKTYCVENYSLSDDDDERDRIWYDTLDSEALPEEFYEFIEKNEDYPGDIQNNNVRPKTLNVEKCSIIESRRKKNIRIETT